MSPPETREGTAVRRYAASAFDGFVLLSGPAAIFALPLANAVGWSSLRGWDGYGMLVAIGGAGAVAALLVLLRQSTLLATRGLTLGMAMVGMRLEHGSPFRRFVAPALSIALPIGLLCSAYVAMEAAADSYANERPKGTPGRDAADAVKDLLYDLVKDGHYLFWIPLALFALGAVVALLTKRPFVDWLAGGRAAIESPPSDPARISTMAGLGALDYQLFVTAALPSVVGTCFARGDAGTLGALAILGGVSVGGLLVAEAIARVTQGGTLGRLALERRS